MDLLITKVRLILLFLLLVHLSANLFNLTFLIKLPSLLEFHLQANHFYLPLHQIQGYPRSLFSHHWPKLTSQTWPVPPITQQLPSHLLPLVVFASLKLLGAPAHLPLGHYHQVFPTHVPGHLLSFYTFLCPQGLYRVIFSTLESCILGSLLRCF